MGGIYGTDSIFDKNTIVAGVHRLSLRTRTGTGTSVSCEIEYVSNAFYLANPQSRMATDLKHPIVLRIHGVILFIQCFVHGDALNM